MLTYTGQYVTIEQGVPTIQDIAVQLGRIPRFMGATTVFWPVLAHSIVVARLCPPEAKLYGLLHDAAEVIVGDVPRTIKTTQQSSKEQQVLYRILNSLGVEFPTLDVLVAVKEADNRALKGEVWIVGTEHLALCDDFTTRDKDAEYEVKDLMIKYPEYRDYLYPNGRMVKDYIKQVKELIIQ